jgi:hypothetical protein
VCKKFEGAVFPLLIKSLKDGVDDPVDTPNVHEDCHRPSAAPNFDKTTLDQIRGPHFLPQMLGTIEEVQ